MNLKSSSYVVVLMVFAIFINSCDDKKIDDIDQETKVIEDSAMVVSAHRLATEVGVHVLQEGGNAFDAAVAVQFALTVVYPRAGNIGGGGFATYRLANGEYGTLDFREKAPKAAHANMFLDSTGNVMDKRSKKGIFSVGIPGTIRGMDALQRKFGKLKWDDVIAPSIRLALLGFPLSKDEANILNKYRDDFIEMNGINIPYVKEENWQEGDSIKFPELAETIFRIGEKGSREFYRGLAAKKIVAESRRRGGVLTIEDMNDYEVVWRKPVVAELENYKIISMGAPSSGGIALIQLLKGADLMNMNSYPHNSTSAIHLMTELERRVYADRATHLGDPDFYDVPEQMLLSTEYLKSRFADINMSKASLSSAIKEGEVDVIESHETTHYSIVDQWGNAVSITTTLNGNFGSKVLVTGAGFFLNNEMDDFSVKPGVPNQFGLVGGEANAIAPEKRMLSSMCPTIVEKDGKLFMAVGTPGGSTIITSTYQTIQNAIWYDMRMQDAVNATKTHAQWLPDEIHLEEGRVDSLVIDSLTKMGHNIKYWETIGKMNCIMILENGDLEGAADYKRSESVAIGF